MGKDNKAVKDQAFVRVSAAREAVSQAHEEAGELVTCYSGMHSGEQRLKSS